MNTLQVFENPEFGSIRTVEIGAEPWLVGKDVAVALGYNNPRDALKKHVDAEDKGVSQFTTPSGNQRMTIINESGLYSLILSSKLPGAKKFKRWITTEVLPSIRKTGSYSVPAEQKPSALEKKVDDLTAAVQLMAEQMAALAAREAPASAPVLALPGSGDQQDFGPAARKKWMRTASEKLELLSTKMNHLPHNMVLSQLYKIMEAKGDVNLEEERLRVAEERNLFPCSILAAISYNEILRERFQNIVDFNLAPENRGW